MKTKRSVGRPPSIPDPTKKRCLIGARISANLKERLVLISHRTGRSMSQEVEHLLELALDREQQVELVLAKLGIGPTQPKVR